jgi:hypothetical protein
MIVAENVDDGEMVVVDAHLFESFTFRGSNRILMGVECSTGQGPGSSAVGPQGAKLQENMWFGKVTTHEQEACCSVQSPMVSTAVACHPAIAVT